MSTLQNNLVREGLAEGFTENVTAIVPFDQGQAGYEADAAGIQGDIQRHYREENVNIDRLHDATEAAHCWRKALIYAGATAFCFLFAMVYNRFSHGVHSPYMTFLFCWPLVLGWIPAVIEWLLASRKPVRERPRGYAPLSSNLYHSGVAALTAGSMLRGIFEIAGTASVHQEIIMGGGLILAASGIVLKVIPFLHGKLSIS